MGSRLLLTLANRKRPYSRCLPSRLLVYIDMILAINILIIIMLTCVFCQHQPIGSFQKVTALMFRDNGSLTNEGKQPSEAAQLWGDLANSIDSDNKSSLSHSFSASHGLDKLGAINISSQQQYVSDDRRLLMSVNIANILIFVTGFCGNSLVILVILRFTRIETVTDIYILNLAFADFMFLFGLVFLILTMFIDHWIFGNIMCKLYMASTSLNQFASSLLLVVMSFDRFLAVCHPIYAQRFRRLSRAKLICLGIWIMCLILMSPIFVFANTNTYPLTNENTTCAIIWPEYKSINCEIAFTLYSFAIGFAFPLLLIAAFYTCVIKRLRIAASGQMSLGSSRRSRNRETTNKRIEHLVIGIICTYTICWLPYWISQLVVSFNTTFGKEPTKEPFKQFYAFVLVATCLSYTNSALNPILYAFLSDNFKRRCADVFRFITSINWCGHRPGMMPDAHSTIATGLYEPSQVNNNEKNYFRPDSRQTVVMNESVRLVTSPSQLSDILANTTDVLTNNNHCNHHTTSIMDSKTPGGRTTLVEDMEDRDLARQHMIGSKLTRLHNSLSRDEDDYPIASNTPRDKHCFANQLAKTSNLTAATTATTTAAITGHMSSNNGNNKSGSSRYLANEMGDNGSCGGSRGAIDGGGLSGGSKGNSKDSSDIAHIGVHQPICQVRKRSVAFSVDTMVVQGPNNGGDQMVEGGGGGGGCGGGGDHATTILQAAASSDWRHPTHQQQQQQQQQLHHSRSQEAV